MRNVKVVGGKTQNGHYVEDVGIIYQIKNPLGPCETFIKAKNIVNNVERDIYFFVGFYPVGVNYDSLLEADKANANKVISITSKTSVIK